MVGLHAPDLLAHHDAGQQRIFAGIFEVAAIARFAQQVHGAGQQHVVAGLARLAPYHGAACVGQLRVPGGRRGQARRQGRPRIRSPGAGLGSDADAGVRLPLRRQAEASDAGHEAGRIGTALRRTAIVLGWKVRAKIAEYGLDFFVQRHGAHQQGGPLVGWQGRIKPWLGRPAGTVGGRDSQGILKRQRQRARPKPILLQG